MKYVASSALLLLIALRRARYAQDAWPERPLRSSCFTRPAVTDLVGRLTARYVEKALGKPVVIENRRAPAAYRDAGRRDCGA